MINRVDIPEVHDYIFYKISYLPMFKYCITGIQHRFAVFPDDKSYQTYTPLFYSQIIKQLSIKANHCCPVKL
jgi:hypothetical protein